MFGKMIPFFICTMFLTPCNAHFMSRVWPQKGFAPVTAGSPDAAVRILIAGKGSAFRDTVISRLTAKLLNDSTFIQIIDLQDLSTTRNPDEWNAILLVNRCVAWDYDALVKKFMKAHPDYPHLVVFTTSGDPEGCFSKEKQRKEPPVDAYSCASRKDNVSSVVDTLYNLLQRHVAE